MARTKEVRRTLTVDQQINAALTARLQEAGYSPARAAELIQYARDGIRRAEQELGEGADPRDIGRRAMSFFTPRNTPIPIESRISGTDVGTVVGAILHVERYLAGGSDRSASTAANLVSQVMIGIRGPASTAPRTVTSAPATTAAAQRAWRYRISIGDQEFYIHVQGTQLSSGARLADFRAAYEAGRIQLVENRSGYWVAAGVPAQQDFAAAVATAGDELQIDYVAAVRQSSASVIRPRRTRA